MPKATFDNRQEYTDAKGKVFHSTDVENPPGVIGPVEHVGPWLLCEVCNPVQVIAPEPGMSELVALRAEYDQADKEAKAAAERLEAVKAKLKSAMAPTEGGTRSALHIPGFPPLLLTYSESWRLDSKALKADAPTVWVGYAKQSTSWTLSVAKGGQ